MLRVGLSWRTLGVFGRVLITRIQLWSIRDAADGKEIGCG